MKNKLRDYSSMILIASLIIVLDRISKWVIDTYLAVGETWLPASLEWLLPYARIVKVINKGAAFGMLQDMRIVFIIITPIIMGVIVYFYSTLSSDERWMRVALSMLLGGAFGNFIDRVFFGQVTDFFSVGTFAVFNVADSFVTVSAIMLVIAVLMKEYQEKKATRMGVANEEQPVVTTNADSGSEL